MEMTTEKIRTEDDVKRILGFAKLDSTEVKYNVQCLTFAAELDNDSVRLLEMDASVLNKLQEGQSVVVRGNKTDTAVLCTDDQTFDIRLAETSNLLLILPECDVSGDAAADGEELRMEHQQICALKQDYYELRPIKPRLKMMRFFLEENLYSGQECEQDEHHQGKKYTFDDLLEDVQASSDEIRQGLADLQACLIDGHWRLLDFDFIYKVLSDILSLKDEQGWSYDNIPAKCCCEELGEIYPRAVVVHVLRCMSDLPQDENLHADPSIAGERTYKFSEDKVCRFFAEVLLRPVDKFNLTEFLETWQQAVPEGLKTGLYQLEGVVLVERDTKAGVIRHYNVADLPETIGDRFNKLFTTKAKWTLDEISPFIKDLCTEKLGISGLLTKFARASTQTGIKVYSSKKPLS